jgi:hypothetical protein
MSERERSIEILKDSFKKKSTSPTRRDSEIAEIKSKLAPPLNPAQLQEFVKKRSQENYFPLSEVHDLLNENPKFDEEKSLSSESSSEISVDLKLLSLEQSELLAHKFMP